MVPAPTPCGSSNAFAGGFGRGFALGARVGGVVVANSDGHKGRQGASHPGALQFGSYGGLTCVLARGLTRAGVFDALRRRHHYATSNAARVFAETGVELAREAARHVDDPKLGGAPEARNRWATMGDIWALRHMPTGRPAGTPATAGL